MSWTINGTQVDGLRDVQPAPTPGSSGDYPFGFRPTSQAPNDHISRFETLRDYAISAGQFDTYESIPGDIYWREQQTSGPSPLVEVQPPAGNQIAHPFWGLIDSVEDATIYGQSDCELSLSITFITPYGTGTDEFDTESALRAGREVTGP